MYFIYNTLFKIMYACHFLGLKQQALSKQDMQDKWRWGGKYLSAKYTSLPGTFYPH